jgi:hypothetical protein
MRLHPVYCSRDGVARGTLPLEMEGTPCERRIRMRKIAVTLGLSILVSLLVAGACSAGATDGKNKKEPGVYSGEVTELDLKTSRMVVAQNNTDLAMVFNMSKAKAGSGYKELADLKMGDQVTVKFEAKVGIMYALKVSKGEKPAPRTKPTGKPHS